MLIGCSSVLPVRYSRRYQQSFTHAIEYSTLFLSVTRDTEYKSSGHNDFKLSSDRVDNGI